MFRPRLAACVVVAVAVVSYAAPFVGEYVPVPRIGRRHAMSVDPLDGTSLRSRLPITLGKFSRVAAPVSSFPNNLVNDPTGEDPGEGNTQMEPTLDASGDTLVCGFTDTMGIWGTGSLTGFAVSFDGGETWNDRGSLPSGSGKVWGDATILTDGVGRWYCVSVFDIGNGVGGEPGDLALVLHKGHFVGTTLVWSAPRQLTPGLPGDAPDSPHAVLDVAADRLYVASANLGVGYDWGQIEVRTIGNHGMTDIGTVIVQPQTSEVNNSGPRIALGPDGEVYCAWESGLFTNNGQGPAYQKIARSIDHGLTFSAPVTAAAVNCSWLSGPPGFNRLEEFVEFPSLAVDRSNGPNRGRVYLAWHDAVWRNYNGTMTMVPETAAPNDEPQTAQVLPSTTDHWQIEGSVAGGDFFDWYRFDGNAGEHLRFILRPNTYMQLSTFLYCRPTGAPVDTILTGSERYAGVPVFLNFTLPFTGDYWIRVARHTNSGTYTGWLRKTTSTSPSTAIDTRDVVVVSSPDGLTNWSPKVRINDDTDWTDQSFPEIVVDGDGGAHVLWYDRRFDPASRVLADVMLSSSFDGGQTFTPNLRLTNESSFWQVSSDGVPNFGDWFRPLAQGTRLFPVWTDGRYGSPDVLVTPLQTGFDAIYDDTIRAFMGQPLGFEVTVRNDTPWDDARFEVTFAPSISSISTTTVQVGPVVSGASAVASFSPIIGGSIPGVWQIDIIVESDRSSHVESGSTTVLHDAVDVQLADFVASAGPDGIRLEWRAEGSEGFHVERSAAREGPYERVSAAMLLAESSARYKYLDTRAVDGERVWYRLLAVESNGRTTAFGPYEVEAAVPRAVRFQGAQPNPFNPTTMLRFELPRESRVTLRILDVQGRLVTTLLQGESRAGGDHAVLWDGRGTDGRVQASGVYIAELRADDAVRTSRLVLLR